MAARRRARTGGDPAQPAQHAGAQWTAARSGGALRRRLRPHGLNDGVLLHAPPAEDRRGRLCRRPMRIELARLSTSFDTASRHVLWQDDVVACGRPPCYAHTKGMGWYCLYLQHHVFNDTRLGDCTGFATCPPFGCDCMPTQTDLPPGATDSIAFLRDIYPEGFVASPPVPKTAVSTEFPIITFCSSKNCVVDGAYSHEAPGGDDLTCVDDANWALESAQGSLTCSTAAGTLDGLGCGALGDMFAPGAAEALEEHCPRTCETCPVPPPSAPPPSPPASAGADPARDQLLERSLLVASIFVALTSLSANAYLLLKARGVFKPVKEISSTQGGSDDPAHVSDAAL